MATEDDLDVEAELTVKDKASDTLRAVYRHTEKLAGKFDQLLTSATRGAAAIGGFAAAFGLASSYQGAVRYVDQIERLRQLTGISANNVAGISDAFEESGVEGTALERILIGVSKKAASIAGGSKEAAKAARAMGIDLKKGPEAAFIRMADLVQKNKVSAGQVAQTLGVSAKNLTGTMDLLRKGPAEVARLFEEGRRKNKMVTDETVGAFDDFQDASHRVGMAWRRLFVSVILKLGPALEAAAAGLEKRIDGWASAADKFGNFLRDHMDQAIAGAKALGRVMATNYAITRLTGEGLLTNITKAVKMVGGSSAFRRFMALGRGVTTTAAYAGPIQQFGKIAGPALGSFTQTTGALGGVAGLAANFAKLGAVGLALGAIIGALWLVFKNVGGAADSLKSRLSDIFSSLMRIGQTLAKIFSGDAPLGKFIRMLGEGLLWVVDKVLMVVDKILGVINLILQGVAVLSELAENIAHPVKWATKKIMGLVDIVSGSTDPEALIKKYAAKGAAGAAGKKNPADPNNTGGPINYQDFRGSRFEITQKFSDGFDPDRVAVAFANELGALGEQRLQSGLTPAFTVR